MQLHTASIESTVGNKIWFFFPSPFYVSTSLRLTSGAAFGSDYLAACGTALSSTTEENESGRDVAVSCPSKVKQRSSTADWLKV